MDSISLYEWALSKAAGDRGGRVVGRTKSGKPVYAEHKPDHKIYGNYTGQDHMDASRVHETERQAYKTKMETARGGDYATMSSHSGHHRRIAELHREIAARVK